MEKPFIIAGPCVIESAELLDVVAAELKRISEQFDVPVWFKASFDKANRTSIHSFRGPGLERGLQMLADVKTKYGLPLLTDVHESFQAEAAGEVVDVLQIPAFLCRQSDLLVAAARTGKTVNIKKAQFLSGDDMRYPVEKCREAGCREVWLTERGNISDSGFVIGTPLTAEGSCIAAKPDIKIYGRGRVNHNYAMEKIWVKNFDIKFFVPQVDGRDSNDSDTEYTITINEFNADDDKTEFRLCTFDSKNCNYSAVAYPSGGDYKMVSDVNTPAASGLRPEEQYCYRVANQYSTVKWFWDGTVLHSGENRYGRGIVWSDGIDIRSGENRYGELLFYKDGTRIRTNGKYGKAIFTIQGSIPLPVLIWICTLG